MSKETYSIPMGIHVLYNFQRNVVTLCTDNASLWTISATKLTAIAPIHTNYELKYAIANNKNPQSPSITTARNVAWDVLEVALIDLYNHSILNNAVILPTDKDALHIHYLGENTGRPSPASITTAIITLVSEKNSMLHVIYSDSSEPNRHYKSVNVAFCELWYKVGELAPTDIANASERYNTTRSQEGIVFSPDQRGKTIYSKGRWLNKNGKYGPRSIITSA